MPSISTNETHELKSVDGAHATVRRITEMDRTEFRESLLDLDTQLLELSEDRKLVDAGEKDPQKLRAISREYNKAIEAISRAWVTRFLVSTDLDIDGVPVTKDNIEQKAPKAFYDEVVNLIRDRAELGGVEIKNSESPSTSSEAAATNSNDTTVPVAE